MTDFKFTRSETANMYDTLEYIESTYGAHYAGNQDIQLIDYWKSMGIMLPVAIGTSIKYLARFGKKGGYNRRDIHKAIHYALLALWAVEGMEPEAEADPSDPMLDLPEDDLVDVPLPPELIELMRGAFQTRGEQPE